VTDLAVHKAWREVRRGDDSSPEAQAYRSAIGDVLALAEIRARRGLTQVDVARVLQTSQASVSKIERREDLYLSTLRGFVEALGGRLELAAVFPEGRIAITGPGEEPTSGHATDQRPAMVADLSLDP
jgi:DNA-binding XRE family transcriptional regulator